MLSYKKGLLEKFKSSDAVIGIVGLGHVGLVLLLRYSSIGLRVVGIDIDKQEDEKLIPKMRKQHFELSSEPLTAENLASFDVVLLTTAQYRFEILAARVRTSKAIGRQAQRRQSIAADRCLAGSGRQQYRHRKAVGWQQPYRYALLSELC